MSSREDILQNIRRNTRVRYEKPDLSALEQGAITYADQVAQFCKVVAEVGGRVVTVNEGEDVIKLPSPATLRRTSFNPKASS